MLNQLNKIHNEYEVSYSVRNMNPEIDQKWLFYTFAYTDEDAAKARIRDAVGLQEEFAKRTDEYPEQPMLHSLKLRQREVFASPWENRTADDD